MEVIKTKIEQKASIIIYPEAHIWPYYTKIRDFKSVSFSYPVKLDVPSFCITNTYQKTNQNKLQIISYIDGPFFPNKSLNYKEAQKDLRDRIYKTMCERSKNSTEEVIKYIKR